MDNYTYDAFISYRHMEHDKKIAEKLQRLLEAYKPPKNVNYSNTAKIKRIFRDESELPTSGDLGTDIKKALEQSAFLIVICSKDTRESQWCMQEIDYFKQLHNGNCNNILTLLVNGNPREVFPNSLCYENRLIELENGDIVKQSVEIEPLAANVASNSTKTAKRKLNTEFLRIAAPILGCRYDDLYKRHQRRFIRNFSTAASAIIAFLILFSIYAVTNAKTLETQASQILKNQKELQSKNDELNQNKKEIENINEQLKKNNEDLQKQIEETLKQKGIADEQTIIAKENEQKAMKSEQSAKDSEQKALENLQIANEQKALAEKNLKEARKQRKLAEYNADLANENSKAAKIAKNEAIANENKAIKQRDQALSNQSLYVASIAEEIKKTGNKTLAMRLLLSALPNNMQNPDRPYVPEAMRVLNNILYDNQPGNSILKHENFIYEAVLNSDGYHLVTISNTSFHALKVWDIRNGKELPEFSELNVGISNCCISADGNYAAVVIPDNGSYIAKILSTADGKVINEIHLDENAVQCSLSSKGSILFITTSKNIVLYNTKTGERMKSKSAYAYYFSSNEKIAITKELNKLKIWNTNNHINNAEKWSYIGSVNANLLNDMVIFSKDNNKVAFVNNNGGINSTVITYDLNKAKEIRTISCSLNSGIYSFALNSNGSSLTLGYYDGKVEQWNIAKGVKTLEFIHEGPSYPDPSEYESSKTAAVSHITFNNDDSIMATSSYAGNVKLWDSKTGLEIASYQHEGYVVKSIFTPDQKQLITVSMDKTVRVWNIVSDNITTKKLNAGFFTCRAGNKIIFDIIKDDLLTRNYKEYNIIDGSIRKIDAPYGLKVTYGGYGISRKPDIGYKDLSVWDENHTKKITSFSFEKEINDASISKDNKKMVVSLFNGISNPGIIELYDISSKKLLHRWKIGGCTRSDVNFSYDDSKIIVCFNHSSANDGWDLNIYDLDDYSETYYSVKNNYPNYMISKKNDTILVTEVNSEKLIIRDLLNNRKIIEIKNEFGWLDANAHFSESEDLVFITTSRQEGAGATSAGKFVYQCFQLSNGRELFASQGMDEISNIAFSPDNRYVAYSTYDNYSCIIWDTIKGMEVSDIPTQNGILAIYFMHDSNNLVLVYQKDDLYIEYIKYTPESSYQLAKDQLGDISLTEEEKNKYFINNN